MTSVANAITVRRVHNPTDADIASYVALLHASFGPDDPPSHIFTGNDREGRIDFQFEAILRAAAIAGEIHGAFSTTAPGTGSNGSDENADVVAGIAVWYLPGTDPMASPEEQRVVAKWMDGMPMELREWWINYFIPVSANFDRRVLGPTFRTDSYFLDLLGVHPSFQRRGVARTLLEPMFERAKSDRKPLVVRVGLFINITIYERLGYKLRGEQLFTSPWGDMTMYLMVKDADED